MRRRNIVVVATAITVVAAGGWWAKDRVLGRTVLLARGAKYEARIVETETPFPFCFMFCRQAYLQVDDIRGRIWRDLYEGGGGYETEIDQLKWTSPTRVQFRRTLSDDSLPDVLTFDLRTKALTQGLQ